MAVEDTSKVKVEFSFPPGETVTLVGERVALTPFGIVPLVRLTVPEKVPRLLTDIVEVPEDPIRTLTTVGLDEIAKSGGSTLVATSRLLKEEPLVAVTLTL